MSYTNRLLQDPAATPLGKAIQVIGIGKNGSKALTADQLQACREALALGTVDPLQKGAFIGALLAKGPTPEERTLESLWGRNAFAHPTFLINTLCPDLAPSLLPIASKLLRGHTLQASEAHQLGEFLLADGGSETFRGLAASYLRVRHETIEEYKGLHAAVVETYAPGFQQISCVGPPLVQLAEPFDGVEHSYLLTPLLAHYVEERGYGAISLVGRTPGPKFSLNAHDLYLMLGCPMLQTNHELDNPPRPFGWVLDQKALSPALNRWVDRRRVLLKRPFLATLEKLLNPCHARILITSVFHITYQMKMAELALLTGFDAVIVLKRGLEGSLAPSTSRASGVLCAVRTPRGHLFYQHFEADLPAFADFHTESDEIVPNVQAIDNARLVRQFLEQGKSGNDDFDNRVRFARALFGRGLDWIEGQLR